MFVEGVLGSRVRERSRPRERDREEDEGGSSEGLLKREKWVGGEVV